MGKKGIGPREEKAVDENVSASEKKDEFKQRVFSGLVLGIAGGGGGESW